MEAVITDPFIYILAFIKYCGQYPLSSKPANCWGNVYEIGLQWLYFKEFTNDDLVAYINIEINICSDITYFIITNNDGNLQTYRFHLKGAHSKIVNRQH